jgi:hypothetical protein
VGKLVRIISVVIILLGVVHIAFAFPIQLTTDTLWFVGSGVAIIMAGMLNLVAIDTKGSWFTHWVAVVSNALMCALFCFSILILNEPQVYVGIIIFLISMIAFIIELRHKSSVK